MNQFYSFDESSIPLWVKALFWGLYMVVFVYAVWKLLLAAPRDKRRVNACWLIVPFFATYAVFYCVNPDYFRYRDWLEIPFFLEWEKEDIYVFFILLCRSIPFEYPFELFRLIVWGGGLLLVFFTARMYRSVQMPLLVVLFLFVTSCCTYSYGRVSLAMAVYYLGVSLCMWKKSFWGKLLGITIAISSYFFHHELIIGVGVLPCLLFPFEKKETILFSLILLAIMIAGIAYINSNVELLESVFGADEMADKVEHFNEAEQRVFRMSTLVGYLNLFYPFFLITKSMYRHKNTTPKAIKGIYRVTFVLLLATISFFIVSGPRSVYTYRVLYITIIPMAIMNAYNYNQGYIKKYQLAAMFLLSILTNSIRLINAI